MQFLCGASLFVAAITGWSEPTGGDSIIGEATYYSPGLMQKVIDNRGYKLYGFIGGVALNRKGDLGRAVWLEWEPGQITGPYLSVDCAQRVHYSARVQSGYIVEVSAEEAKERGFYGIGPVPVRVLFKLDEMIRGGAGNQTNAENKPL